MARDVPEEVCGAAAQGAQQNWQSLDAYVGEQLREIVQVFRTSDYVAS